MRKINSLLIQMLKLYLVTFPRSGRVTPIQHGEGQHSWAGMNPEPANLKRRTPYAKR